jgi:hypothetical protein
MTTYLSSMPAAYINSGEHKGNSSIYEQLKVTCTKSCTRTLEIISIQFGGNQYWLPWVSTNMYAKSKVKVIWPPETCWNLYSTGFQHSRAVDVKALEHSKTKAFHHSYFEMPGPEHGIQPK